MMARMARHAPRINVSECCEDLQPGWDEETIFIPQKKRRLRVERAGLCIRTANVLGASGIVRVGDLHGLTYEHCGRFRMVGITALLDIRGMVRRLQKKYGGIMPFEPRVRIWVPAGHGGQKIGELPLSRRLANVLTCGGYARLGELQGVDVEDLYQIENCTVPVVLELLDLLSRLEAGQIPAIHHHAPACENYRRSLMNPGAGRIA